LKEIVNLIIGSGHALVVSNQNAYDYTLCLDCKGSCSLSDHRVDITITKKTFHKITHKDTSSSYHTDESLIVLGLFLQFVYLKLLTNVYRYFLCIEYNQY